MLADQFCTLLHFNLLPCESLDSDSKMSISEHEKSLLMRMNVGMPAPERRYLSV